MTSRKGAHRASPVRQHRSTKAELAAIDDAIVAAVAADATVTLHGVVAIGVDAWRAFQDRVIEFLYDRSFVYDPETDTYSLNYWGTRNFERLAVTPEQIETMPLPRLPGPKVLKAPVGRGGYVT
jgi:hypothetical protein